jgi:hypothetical protein
MADPAGGRRREPRRLASGWIGWHGVSLEWFMAVTTGASRAAVVLLAQAGTAAHGPTRALGLAALCTWLLDAGSGVYMLSTWIRRGGPRRVRAAGEGLAPWLVFTHFGLASSGLLLWISYLVTQAAAVAWVAITLLVVVIGLGISTVTLWTPFPAARVTAEGSRPGAADPAAGEPARVTAEGSHPDALTDDLLARALTDEALLRRLVDDVVASVPAGPRAPPARPARKPPREHLAALIPAGHGIAALATVLLAVLTAVTAL